MTTDAPAQREAGWYWVAFDASYEGEPAQWSKALRCWFTCGSEEHIPPSPTDRVFYKLPPTTPANPEPDEAVVERVKQAIYLSHYTVGDVPLSRQPKQIDRHCEKLASAALAALPAQPKAEASDLLLARGLLADDPDDMDDAWLAEIIATVRRETETAAGQAGRDEAIRKAAAIIERDSQAPRRSTYGELRTSILALTANGPSPASEGE